MAFNSNYVSISTNKHTTAFDRWSVNEPSQRFRSPFSRDRDRILYSTAFLRLKDKTQVFMAKDRDYLRTRLTHTLEVSQIAKTIAIALGLNVELTEAIALGHDVGHTPFGHIGERTLSHLLNGCEEIKNLTIKSIPADQKGFKHNLQALRVLCDLEIGSNGVGLNLTKYVLWGISHHTKIHFKSCLGLPGTPCWEVHDHHSCSTRALSCAYYDRFLDPIKDYWSFEGYVVKLADEIAQRHHDIEDCLRYGLIDRAELLSHLNNLLKGFSLLPESKQNLKALEDGIDKSLNEFLPLFSRFIVNFLVVDAIQNSKKQLKDFGARNHIGKIEDFVNCKSGITEDQHNKRISFSPAVEIFDNSFEAYLTKNVLGAYEAQVLDGKGAFIIRRLFSAYVSNPYQLPDSVIDWFYHDIQKPFDRSAFTGDIIGNEATFVRVVADYIGGMTDGYAYSQYDLLYGTRV